MHSKLTLSIEKRIIEKAKSYAKKSNRSLSEIIQSYLETITSSEEEFGDDELNSIKGVISLDEGFDLKNEIRNIRREKHMN